MSMGRFLKVMMSLAAVFVGYLVTQSIPDVRRYLRMRGM